MQTQRKRRGFTLIELLVVIAIIMILAAILFPVFQRTIDNAERTSCASNMKQMALAFQMYTQDNSSRYPPVQTGWIGYWYRFGIQPYLKSDDLAKCPSGNNERASYAMNSDLHVKNTSKVTTTSLTILNWEKAYVVPNTPNTGCGRQNLNEAYGPSGLPIFGSEGCVWPALPPPAGPANSAGESVRHLDGANYSFVDGHVKWLKPDSVKVDGGGSSIGFKVY